MSGQALADLVAIMLALWVYCAREVFDAVPLSSGFEYYRGAAAVMVAVWVVAHSFARSEAVRSSSVVRTR